MNKNNEIIKVIQEIAVEMFYHMIVSQEITKDWLERLEALKEEQDDLHRTRAHTD